MIQGTAKRMADSTQNAFTPSALNRRVRTLLESHFDLLWVEGEVSNFAMPASGHWYFTLKDDSAQVRCAMFRNRNSRLRFRPRNGDQVRLRARVSLYEGRGEFQLIGEFLEPAGAGALQAQFEALRDKLRDEGLFDAERKQMLPRQIEHLAVITSPTGAALQDILQVLARRNPGIEVTVLGAAVQGEQAPLELVRAVERANQLASSDSRNAFDAILLARGGGSLEDLWAFNNEALARAIAASTLPLVSGVGHEVDVTIADFAADLRAPTPSAAAELLSEDQALAINSLRAARATLARNALLVLERRRSRVTELTLRLRHPLDRIHQQQQRVDDLSQRLQQAVDRMLIRLTDQIEAQRLSLGTRSPQTRLLPLREGLAFQSQLMEQLIARRQRESRALLDRQRRVLESLSPLAILNRGYAIVTDEQGCSVRSGESVHKSQRLAVRLAKGGLLVDVAEVNPEG